ncbi:hypothetical protein [Algivirga pacifica]|uniref:CRISPR-associated endoribonuclease Cas2 n=1 Tax=Algivirga pacifica TaxID=1162670 RepID=A0ABP9DBP8_9BACT
MHYFICYDISNNGLRTRLYKKLLAKGCDPVQKSILLAADFAPKEIKELKTIVKEIMDGSKAPQDSVMVIPVSKEHYDKIDLFNSSAGYQKVRQEKKSKFF